MVDVFSKEKRSEIMSKVKGRDTSLEIKVRKELWKRKKGYRLNDPKLPGRPDISFRKQKVAIFLDGCFWHGCPEHFRIPDSNTEYWSKKIEANIERRNKVRKVLQDDGYTVLEFFECKVKREFQEVIEEICDCLRLDYK